MRNGSFLGVGWSFPIRIAQNGNWEMAYFEKSIAESIRIILGTSLGERVMRPDFGCRISELVFAPNNARTHNLLCHYIEEALIQWEPRIILEKVEANPDEDDDARISINIEYKIRAVNTFFNMVYPFYLERGENDSQSQFG